MGKADAVQRTLSNFMKSFRFIALVAFCQLAFIVARSAKAEDLLPKTAPCDIKDSECIHQNILQAAKSITNKSERDKTYRELAKSWARSGQPEQAMTIIPLIETPDTRAMTIRGIGMEIANIGLTYEQRSKIYADLRTHADKLKFIHEPSYAIALTYIAMGQAFAGDDNDARKTAGQMENAALRHKAFGETAEIQAERKDYANAKITLDKIEDIPYKNKALATVSRLLADRDMLSEAYDAAKQITNPYLMTTALQYIVDKQNALNSAVKTTDDNIQPSEKEN